MHMPSCIHVYRKNNISNAYTTLHVILNTYTRPYAILNTYTISHAILNTYTVPHAIFNTFTIPHSTCYLKHTYTVHMPSETRQPYHMTRYTRLYYTPRHMLYILYTYTLRHTMCYLTHKLSYIPSIGSFQAILVRKYTYNIHMHLL